VVGAEAKDDFGCLGSVEGIKSILNSNSDPDITLLGPSNPSSIQLLTHQLVAKFIETIINICM
jgi:hypothetical protein